MTLPCQRTRAVLDTREFLRMLISPYNGGYKRVPKAVREHALRLLRHYPIGYELTAPRQFDKRTVEQWHKDWSCP